MNPTQKPESARPQEEQKNQTAPANPMDPQSEPDWDTRPDLQDEEDRLEFSKRWGRDLPDGGRELHLRLWREGGVF